MTVWGIILAAGNGDRFGAPKQYQPLGDRRVVDWSLAAARATCHGLVLVVSPPATRIRRPTPTRSSPAVTRGRRR